MATKEQRATWNRKRKEMEKALQRDPMAFRHPVVVLGSPDRRIR